MVKNILRVLQDNEFFYLHDGSVIKSIRKLASSIKTMDDSIFKYHVNQERNDFANWVGFLSDDFELKGRLRKCLEKGDMAKLLNNEISNLSKISTAVKKAQLPVKPLKAVKKKVLVKKKIAKKPILKKKVPVKKKMIIKAAKKKVTKKISNKRKAPGITKTTDKKTAAEYITSGIKEYLLGIITGLILGLIIGAML